MAEDAPAPPAASSNRLAVLLAIAGAGLGLLVSQLKTTRSPRSRRSVSEAAGVNSATGSFGLAFAGAIRLATLSITFTTMAEAGAALRPAARAVALLIPILAGLVGLFNSFRTVRLPDPAPSTAVEGVALG